MKKYFTKYLPVPGKAKVGDIVLTPSGEYQPITEGHLRHTPDKQVYELFLCSHDIKEGDAVHMVVGELNSPEEIIYPSMICYKVEDLLYVDLHGTPIDLNLSKDFKVIARK